MVTVDTVRGPVPSDALGAVLPHEHIFVKNPELELNHPSPEWDEQAMVETAARGLDILVDKGISTIVDLTVMGGGRSIGRIQEVAARTRMNIVAATGYYTSTVLPSYFNVHRPGGLVDGPDRLADFFRADVERGIGGTDVRAGVIKVVTDAPGLTPDVRRVLDAAARTHLETGVPIFTHTHARDRTGLLQQEVLAAAGVPLDRVLIGHCDGSTDLDYLTALMDAGSTIGLDQFGLTGTVSDEQRVETLCALLDRGYAKQLTLSHDFAYFSINIEPSDRAKVFPRWNNTQISDEVLPELRRRGYAEDVITAVMVDNPARLLRRG